ncbi:MAG: hypothetical protein C0483_02740 [Pirellula sp.]|nr:hypothetical protein [Pirellula sp.]
MAGKLITLEEAAHILGVSASEVGEMRQRQEIYGYRDGGSWKFKQDEVERLATDRSGMSPAAGGSGILPVDLDGGDQVVLSEFELGDSGPGSSTVIGGGSKKPDSDLKLNTDSGLDLAGSSDLFLAGDSVLSSTSKGKGKDKAGDSSDASNVLGGGGSSLDILGSDVRLAGDSNVLSGSAPLPGGSMAAGKTMLTAELAEKSAPESSIKLTMRDSESVFGDSGSDVTHNVGGSGINLLGPQDSGMLLDDLDLSGASGLAQAIGDDSEIKGDDDFLLTPSSEGGEDSMDSGSQVIALDGDYGDDATATLLAGDVPGLSAALGNEGMMMGGGGGAMSSGYGTVPDTHFGVGSVVGLTFCTIFMALTGIMMYDIIRSMWSWDTPMSVSSSLMDMIPGVRN